MPLKIHEWVDGERRERIATPEEEARLRQRLPIREQMDKDIEAIKEEFPPLNLKNHPVE